MPNLTSLHLNLYEESQVDFVIRNLPNLKFLNGEAIDRKDFENDDSLQQEEDQHEKSAQSIKQINEEEEENESSHSIRNIPKEESPKASSPRQTPDLSESKHEEEENKNSSLSEA